MVCQNKEVVPQQVLVPLLYGGHDSGKLMNICERVQKLRTKLFAKKKKWDGLLVSELPPSQSRKHRLDHKWNAEIR